MKNIIIFIQLIFSFLAYEAQEPINIIDKSNDEHSYFKKENINIKEIIRITL